MKDQPTEVTIPVWWNIGNGRLLRREDLPFDHPEHPYNYLLREYPGIKPELFGVYHPINEEYKDYTREMLLSKIGELKSIINKL